ISATTHSFDTTGTFFLSDTSGKADKGITLSFRALRRDTVGLWRRPARPAPFGPAGQDDLLQRGDDYALENIGRGAVHGLGGGDRL
ncbi:MAG TPA: hypothetical protein VGG61_00900, partial [Gemmataceae bacterium]